MFQLEQTHYLVAVDYFSNFAELDRLENTLAVTVICKVKQHFARHGIPEIVKSDNGLNSVAESFRPLQKAIPASNVKPTYLQSNRKAENAVKN